MDKDYLRQLEDERPRGFRQAQVLHCIERGCRTAEDIAGAIGCSYQSVREALRSLRRDNRVRGVGRDVETGAVEYEAG